MTDHVIHRLEPCARCGVRADVGCRHRAASGDVPPALTDFAPKKPRGPGPKDFGGLTLAGHKRSSSNVMAAAEALFSKPTP